MSGTYDPTNLRDNRHPLHALGMAFGQRQAMDQGYAAGAPQYGATPLAAQLTARPNPLLGAPGVSVPASPLAGLGAAGPQIGKGLSSLYDWARGNGGEAMPMKQVMPAPAEYGAPDWGMHY